MLDARQLALHGSRRGDWIDHIAVLAELGRVDLDRDVQMHRRLGDDHRQALTAVAAARRREHVVVARGLKNAGVVRQHPIAAVRRRPGDRGGVA